MRRPIGVIAILVALAVATANLLTAPSEPAPAEELTPSPALQAAAAVPPVEEADPATALSSDVGFLSRPSPESIRVMTYNINWDSIFPEEDPKNHSFREYGLGEEFQRVMRAIRPDVVCLQEIHHIRTHQELGAFLSAAAADDRSWQAVNVRDNVIATHHGLVEEGYQLYTRGVRASMAQAAALVDLPDGQFGALDLYVVCAHFKAAGGYGDILERGRQADVMMRQVRDFMTPGDHLDLPANTPFLLLGDFNIYDTDPALHLQTLLTGDIQFEDDYGEDFPPDWDGTALADALPSHNGLGEELYTWRDDSGPFNPGPLDRVIFSDSILQVVNAFVLNTTTLSDDALQSIGLERYDVMVDASTGYYDHLPIVVDFVLVDSP